MKLKSTLMTLGLLTTALISPTQTMALTSYQKILKNKLGIDATPEDANYIVQHGITDKAKDAADAGVRPEKFVEYYKVNIPVNAMRAEQNKEDTKELFVDTGLFPNEDDDDIFTNAPVFTGSPPVIHPPTSNSGGSGGSGGGSGSGGSGSGSGSGGSGGSGSGTPALPDGVTQDNIKNYAEDYKYAMKSSTKDRDKLIAYIKANFKNDQKIAEQSADYIIKTTPDIFVDKPPTVVTESTPDENLEFTPGSGPSKPGLKFSERFNNATMKSIASEPENRYKNDAIAKEIIKTYIKDRDPKNFNATELSTALSDGGSTGDNSTEFAKKVLLTSTYGRITSLKNTDSKIETVLDEYFVKLGASASSENDLTQDLVRGGVEDSNASKCAGLTIYLWQNGPTL